MTPMMLVTDRRIVPGGDLVGAVRAVVDHLPEGSVDVQLRERDLTTRELIRLAEALLPIRDRGARLIVDDRLDVARTVGADGVQLGERSFDVAAARRLWPDAVIGVSCHRSADVADAARQGADYAVLGPIYPTPSSNTLGMGPLGPEVLARAREEIGRVGGAMEATAFPLLATGGITTETAGRVLDCQASSFAVARAILADLDPVAAACSLVRQLGQIPNDPPQLDSTLGIDDHA